MIGMFKKLFLTNLIPALGIFGSTLIVYILTLSRSVYFGDSGELIAVARTLGIAHPPGYPLYTMIAHLFTYLPFGNLAFRVNLFSAVTSSLTIVVVYFICLKLTKNRLASISASLFLAFSYLFWLYSLVAEVFSLNNLFVALIILIAVYILENPNQDLSRRILYIGAFVFGLALTNHHTILFLTPALIFLVLATNPKLLTQPKFLILNTLFIFVGLLPYIYLPLRASQNPILNWGDPTTLQRFLDVLLRREYGTLSLSAGVGVNPFTISPLIFYLISAFWQFVTVGAILVLLGIIALYQNKKAFIFLLLAYLFIGPVFVFLTKTSPDNVGIAGGIERFFLASYVFFPIWIAISFQMLITNKLKLLKYATYLLLFVPILLLILNFEKVNQSKNFLYEEMGQKMFEVMPENSLLVTFGDKGTMIARYFQAGLGQRRDVILVNFHWLPTPWYKENLKRQYPNFSFPYDKYQHMKLSSIEAAKIICLEVVPNIPTFIEDRTNFFNPLTDKSCSYHPQGPLIRLDLPDKKTTKEELEAQDNDFWQQLQQKLKEEKPQDLRTKRILLEYSNAKTSLGILLGTIVGNQAALNTYLEAYEISKHNGTAAHLAAEIFLSKNDFPQAWEWEQKAIGAEPTLAEPSNNLGVLAIRLKQDNKAAISYFRKYSSHAISSNEKQRVLKIITELEKSPK